MSRRGDRDAEGREGTPDVILDFECAGGLLYVSLENLGTSPARDVSVRFDKKIIGIEGEKEISALNMFKHTKFLAPKKRIRAFVDSLPSYVARKQPMVIQVSITCFGKDGQRFDSSIEHDLTIYQDLPET